MTTTSSRAYLTTDDDLDDLLQSADLYPGEEYDHDEDWVENIIAEDAEASDEHE